MLDGLGQSLLIYEGERLRCEKIGSVREGDLISFEWQSSFWLFVVF